MNHSKPLKVFPFFLTLAIGLSLLGEAFFYNPETATGAAQRNVLQPDIPWPNISVNLVTNQVNAPVYVTNAGDGSGRLFIVEQPGLIHIYQNGDLESTPFLDIRDRVLYGGEQGLLSMAFPPGYPSKGYFYVYYTKKNGDNVVARFHLTADPNIADPNSEETILPLHHPTYQNHNGGQLAFGPDGYLYIGTGDGGGGGDPFGNAQNPASLLGKLLRIDVEIYGTYPLSGTLATFIPLVLTADDPVHTASLYTIPPSNPFAGVSGYREEIWALGLRNPWRYSFDRQTHDLYIADVGQNQIEEVDFQPASSPGGENYGWNILEGTHCFSPSSGCTPPSNYSPPVSEYEHGPNESTGCSVTGGFVYRGSQFPGMQGIYFYSDYCGGEIWGLQQVSGAWQSQLLTDTNLNITSYGESENGDLYLATTGGVYRIVENP
jgi:glucose/arabinose dehydrogenase